MQDKQRPGRQPKFTYEFMMMIGRKVVEDKMKYKDIAKLFGCSHGLINSARKMYLTGQPSINFTPQENAVETKIGRMEDQISNLKEQVGELYLENSMLKKALYHSGQIKRNNSSVITSENLDQYQEVVK